MTDYKGVPIASILKEKGSKIGRLIEADEDFIYRIIYRGSELFKDSFYNFEIDMGD